MRSASRGVFYVGMYALNKTHRAAWQEWFSCLKGDYLDQFYTSLELKFSAEEQAYTDPNLIAAHTCGYPLLKRWARTHNPFAVPVFDLQNELQFTAGGTRRGHYSSFFVARADHPADSLDQFCGQRLALNSEMSNSGMNVLRFAISQLREAKPFFSERVLTGGHYESMLALTEGKADIAAIDVVSFVLIRDSLPALTLQLKIIGSSASTMGLPFICARGSHIQSRDLCSAMSAAVGRMDQAARKQLHLSGFEPVVIEDYEKINELENAAISAGYPELN